ncbi:hypothetical protein K6W21_01275 [Burkholderia latens]|uniref:hypothetical protein n=1 Tax=Burkholderia latens TaxID=488446 RepID=UPI001C963903|nr:hypothetical protein [Burkholderia latens]MBY4692722.1 hypothetical protein [Burkholderia latens]
MQLPDAAVGSIIAAAIAGLVVFVSTVLTKEQKTSEFRQAWIDELRKDISYFVSGTSEIVALYRAKSGNLKDQEKFIDDNFKIIHEVQSVEHRIVLRLNPKKHAELIRQVSGFRKGMLAAYAGGNQKELEDALTIDLLNTTKDVLGKEWKRVKRGEPTFRMVKWLAITAVAVLAFWLYHVYVTYTPSPDKDKKESVPTQVFVDNHAQISACVAHDNAGHLSGKVHRKHVAPAPQKCEPGK